MVRVGDIEPVAEVTLDRADARLLLSIHIDTDSGCELRHPITMSPDLQATEGKLFALLYEELRALARKQVHRSSTPVSTTTLVHESYLRLSEAGRLSIEDQRHFLAYASTVMRSIVVDFARENLAQKRGSGVAPVTLNTDIVNSTVANDAQVLEIHEALDQLGALDQRLAKVVEMRYFGGLNDSEIADALQLTTRTVQRDWEKAKLFLRATLKTGD